MYTQMQFTAASAAAAAVEAAVYIATVAVEIAI